MLKYWRRGLVWPAIKGTCVVNSETTHEDQKEKTPLNLLEALDGLRGSEDWTGRCGGDACCLSETLLLKQAVELLDNEVVRSGKIGSGGQFDSDVKITELRR